MKVAIAQINSTVGDLEGNKKKIIEYTEKAKKQNADMVIFPELVITGYPPKDLVLKPSFISNNKEILDEIVEKTRDIASIIGFIDFNGNKLYNSAAIIKDGELIGTQNKTHLPNYDVFDEKRYFTPSHETHVFELNGSKLGVNICEDIWVDEGPCRVQAKMGAKLIINISASPFHVGKINDRKKLLSKRAKENNVTVIYCNIVGGQDDLVFDGGSCIFNPNGDLFAQTKRFDEDLVISDLEIAQKLPAGMSSVEEIYHALILGIRDYIKKNGFQKVVIGLSGGIDSALTAALAVKALGVENVLGISMPSKITSKASIEDAEILARNLGIAFKIIPIYEVVEVYTKVLAEEFNGTKQGTAEENLQARIRGNILMALSNKFNYIVLTTGNKSELSVGYATLYGDMAGGLAAISDVPKTIVYELVNYINTLEREEVIPKNIILKEPTAELREGQKDSDDLPLYEILDPILHAYIEENKSWSEIAAMGFDEKIVNDVIRRIDLNEYKRHQAPIGIKITPRAFGSGRRMPITNKYREGV